jgi:hypothetical protein
LNVPVKNFQIYGDLPGKVIERLTRKFGVGAGAKAPSDDQKPNNSGPKSTDSVPASSTATSPTAASSDTSTPASPKPATPARDPTGQSRNDVADFIKSMAGKNPDDKKMMELADRLARIPIRSHEVKAMLFAPPTPEEMEMIRRQTQG